MSEDILVDKLDLIVAALERIEQSLSGETEPELFEAIAGDGSDVWLQMLHTSEAVYRAQTGLNVRRSGDKINMYLEFYGQRRLHLATLYRGREESK